jgi:hypothetical protein
MARTKSSADQRRARLVDIVESLPEVEIKSGTGRGGDPYLGFRIRKKSFGYYLNDHHGDGIIAVCLKSSPEARKQLVARDPERFYVPPYLGPKGWVALRLDLPWIDWSEVGDLVVTAYRLQAPKRLAQLLE